MLKLKQLLKSKSSLLIIFIYSLIISISTWLKFLMKKYDTIEFVNMIKINDFLYLIIFLIICLLLNLFLFSIFLSHKQKRESKPFNNSKLFIFSSILMIIIYSICLITFYPGGSFYDSYFQLDTPVVATTQHPLFYNLILNIFVVQLGYKIFKNAILGWALYSIIQMFLQAFSISYVIVWMNKKNINKKYIVFLILLFSFIPVYAVYSIYATKDVLFSLTILLYMPLIYELVESNGKQLNTKKFNILYIIYGFLLIFTRSNGIFIYIPMTLILIIKYHKFNIKFIIFGSVALILLNFITTSYIEKKFNIVHYSKESLAIPIQQISSIIYSNRTIDYKKQKLINNIITTDIIKNSYSRENVDEIKWNKDFNTDYLQNHKKEFLILWGELLPKNLDLYIGSYLYQTKYYWQINMLSQNSNMYKDILKEDSNSEFIEKIKHKYKLNSPKFLPKKIYKILSDFYYYFSNFLSEGTCFALYLFMICILIFKKKYKYIIPFITLLFVWITLMLCAPLSSSLRYMYSFLLVLPFMLFITYD